MNIKYNKKQHELRDDPVLDKLIKTKEFVNKNSSTVLGTVIAAAIIVGIGLGFTYFKNSRAANSREDFGNAMVAYSEQNIESSIGQFKSVAEKYRGSASGTMSAYMLASIFCNQNRYDEAITWYESVTKGANIGFVNAQAYEGLAACYEAKSDNAKAISQLEKALTDERIQFRFGAIKWKLALLKKEADPASAIKLCDQIIADTLARDLSSDARYLKALLEK